MNKKIIFICAIALSNAFNTFANGLDSSSSRASKTYTQNEDDPEDVYKPFFRLYLGGFHASSQTSITLNSDKLGRGTTFDPEKLLGLEEKRILPRAEVILNFGNRHELGFTYWTIRRERTRTLTEDIQFGDTAFYINSSVTSKINLSNYAATYRFAIFEKENWNAGVSVGAKVFDVNARLSANLNGHSSYVEERRIYAPIPLLGIHGSINTGKHFLVRGTAEYFKLGINDFDFRSMDARIGIEYYPIKHLGIGADYHYFDTFIKKVPSGKLDGEIDFKFHAFSLYLALRI